MSWPADEDTPEDTVEATEDMVIEVTDMGRERLKLNQVMDMVDMVVMVVMVDTQEAMAGTEDMEDIQEDMEATVATVATQEEVMDMDMEREKLRLLL